MTSASPVFLVDTNVLVYGLDERFAEKRLRAMRLIERLAETGTGAVSTQVLGELFWTATRKLARPLPAAEARVLVEGYARYWPVCSLTARVVVEAVGGVERHGFPYWDALVWATAKLNGLPTVLSEDFAGGSTVEGVRFVNPFAAEFELDALTVI